jgi:DNA invertase Pin-like site-specific DNA recombinase
MSQVEKSGIPRQVQSIKTYCKTHKIDLENLFSDEGVSGTLLNRQSLSVLLLTIKEGDTVLCEDLSRLSRDLLIQESIINILKTKKVSLISVKEGNMNLLETSDPSRNLIRQLFGSIYEFEKGNLVSRLRVSREKIRKDTGKCEGRKGYQELNPVILGEIKKLRRKQKGMKPLSYQKVSDILNERGYTTITGKPFDRFKVHSIVNRYM